ncbi:MAG: hypothetical protein KGL35_15715 [Bradyrhizobium sp.]|nr:hypothetical protein [Bradyrhizobium sp.]
MRAGEIDGRYMNCTPDLGPFGDTFPSASVLSYVITRQDGEAVTANDLQQAGASWPNTLDATKLIPTIGLNAPAGAAGVSYQITLTANLTTQNRLFIRDFYIEVVPLLG